jgi:hypothetical protein
MSMKFNDFTHLVAIGLQARVPMHMTGLPGVGKTEFTKSLEHGFARAGIPCKVIILVGSIREPQDFGGFPVSTPDGVRLLPMAWARDAKRLAEEGYLVVVFLDELTTVPPTTQAAMLRLLTENVCGELQLPDYEPGKGGVVYLCASNTVEWAAGGQEIQPPMANRMWHGQFPMDHETWSEMMMNDFPPPSDVPVVPADYLQRHHHRLRALIAAYVKSAGRDAWLAPPDDPVRRSGPWASGRTWYLASRLLAAIEAVSPGNRLLWSAALAGLVGDQALPFLEYSENLNLPDPEEVLKNPRGLVLPERTDRAYAVCYSLVGAVLNHNTLERWQAAMIALGVAASKNADIPTAAARTLCDKRNRPEGAIRLPAECRPFYDLMLAANLLPKE